MTKQQVLAILNAHPGLIAFNPSEPGQPPQVCLDGWFPPTVILALAWWMQNCAAEDWWHDDSTGPACMRAIGPWPARALNWVGA